MATKTTANPFRNRSRAEIVHFVFLTLALFVFWVVLSGKMQVRYLIIGFVTALAITVATRPLLILPPERTGSSWLSLWDLPWFRIFLYVPWLLWQIIVANVQVAMLILHPKLPIDPKVVKFKKYIPHPVGRFALANSITLTPGTITVDLEADEYTVHCVQGGFVGGVAPAEGEGTLPARVGAVFGAGPAPADRQTSDKGL
jgi:multicomponent Na+:H+ antiporter subunit E